MKNVECLILIALILCGLGWAWLMHGVEAVRLRPEIPVTDQADKTPRRVISAAPSLTDLLFAMGAGHRVVGVTNFCKYPPAAEQLPHIGGWSNPNLEQVLALHPDLVVLQGRHEQLAAFCRRENIAVLHLELDTLADIRQAIRTLGARLNCKDGADHMLRELDEELAAVKQKVAGSPRRRVFFSLGHQPGQLGNLTTVGNGTFLNELIELAGGENIFVDMDKHWPTISKETLLARNPEVIIEAFPSGLAEDSHMRLLADWEALGGTDAIMHDRVVFLTGEYTLLPGSRIDQLAADLARAIHPEAFADE